MVSKKLVDPPRHAARRIPFTAEQVKHADAVVSIVAPVVPVLGLALGESTEVVLHNLCEVPTSIVAIANPVSGRAVGGPITDVGLRFVEANELDDMIGYRTQTTSGMSMRCSNIFFRSPDGRAVACLSLNSDVTDLERAQVALSALTAMPLHPSPQVVDTFPVSVDGLAQGILRDSTSTVGVPVELMKKSHKMQVVQELDDRGFFNIREAVELAAEHLDVSRFTIYNYLNELGLRVKNNGTE
ncbi:transcriptional regulator [Paenarthrobacter sp. JL.01a]|uniref:helix-turn-helix transcriptional regulator n=1 Tax=Paenarthrobacter sp. JL.01a TaxID=2979324 RepID=UPI0021C92F46|nr:helix-turn-helix transcriptional regulator [Paenarthrobacter sp. JL.01a]UXM93485.1 helix-turn-helix transcriptional regulator [Paenarthrobacter sp. JL.01a]